MNKDKEQKECCDRCLNTYQVQTPDGWKDVDDCFDITCPCHNSTPEEEKKDGIRTGYLKVGETIECGNCHPEKYEDCVKISKEYPHIKCNCLCHKSPPPSEEWWVEEFEKRFCLENGVLVESQALYIKQFISKIASQERLRGAEEERERVREWAEKNKWKGNPEMETNQDFGRNQALSDLLSFLQSNKK